MTDLHADITKLIRQGRIDGKRPEVVAHAILCRLERQRDANSETSNR